MIQNLGKTTTITGVSGKKYVFTLFSFEDFADIKKVWNSIPALYLFTRRYMSNGAYYHTYIYLGETGDLSTRFQDHHKEACIRLHSANCIGICTAVPANEAERLEFEKDILISKKFPCNDQNN